MKALINMSGVVDNDIGDNEFCAIVVREIGGGRKMRRSLFFFLVWSEDEGEWRISERMEMVMV
jgi:hypothetical protein